MTLNNTPLVSVCVPVFNGKDFIAEAIDSVLRQTYQNLQILIQDNASTDGTWEIICNWAKKDQRIVIEQNSSNIGMAPNWNKVIKKASGEFVMLLSADDYLLPDFISECLKKFFLYENIDIVTANHYLLVDGKFKKRKIIIREGVYTNFTDMVLLFNPFSINFSLFRKEIISELSIDGNFFNPNYYTCDYDLWYRVSEHDKKVFYIEKPMGVYRVHDYNISRKKNKMNRQAFLVILSHKVFFNKRSIFYFKLTIIRFIIRVIVNLFYNKKVDWRFLKILGGELVKFK